MYVDIVISNIFNLNKHFFSSFLCRGRMPRARGMAAYVRDVTEHFANPNLSVVVAK